MLGGHADVRWSQDPHCRAPHREWNYLGALVGGTGDHCHLARDYLYHRESARHHIPRQSGVSDRYCIPAPIGIPQFDSDLDVGEQSGPINARDRVAR